MIDGNRLNPLVVQSQREISKTSIAPETIQNHFWHFEANYCIKNVFHRRGDTWPRWSIFPQIYITTMVFSAMTCVDNDQFSISKDQNKNKKQEQSIHGPKKNWDRIRYHEGVSIYAERLHPPCAFCRFREKQDCQKKFCLKSSLRKYYGLYNDFLSKYNLTLGCMLTDVFYTNC